MLTRQSIKGITKPIGTKVEARVLAHKLADFLGKDTDYDLWCNSSGHDGLRTYQLRIRSGLSQSDVDNLVSKMRLLLAGYEGAYQVYTATLYGEGYYLKHSRLKNNCIRIWYKSDLKFARKNKTATGYAADTNFFAFGYDVTSS